MDFTDEQLQRYARHIVLPEVGGIGQEKIINAKVLVVGAGGLGAPLLLYLAAAGIGTLGIVDDDVIDLSNLQRQVIHVPHDERLTSANVMRLIADYDVIADGSDNFDTRFLLNDACHLAGKTLVSGAILRFEGQISTFKSHLGPDYPCYRCLYSAPPPPGMIPSCSEGGVLGALAGTVGSLQATEVLKEIMAIGNSLAGNLLLYDALDTTFRKIRLPRDASCRLCGDQPSITDLSAHDFTAKEPA
jgi:adenylyltransferase/sulfurtransferase